MKSLDLNALHHFCEIVREGSLTKAAQKLNVSAPTLSRHLAQLEEQVGHKLVHRHAKQFKLTIDGERYFNSLGEDFSQLQEQISALNDRADVLSGSIRISCPESMAIDYLHDWSLEFLALHPLVDIQIKFAISDQHFVEDQLDLSLVVVPPTQPSLVQRKLFDTQMCVAAAPSYIAAKGKPNVPQDLHQLDLLTSDPQKDWSFLKDGQRHVIFPAPRYSINSIRTVVDAAVKGLGIMYGPLFYMREPLQDGRLVSLLPEFETEMRHVFMVYADRRLMPTRVRAFRSFLEEKMVVLAEGERWSGAGKSFNKVFS
ncbi:LysR family transcriptional regulator [Maritalea sp. S77]|uniref:LysR family transcriptional regulator n=1 Tax=Maritalea sp. S77 TaxID=3415125 RepID=UPI003C7BBB3B